MKLSEGNKQISEKSTTFVKAGGNKAVTDTRPKGSKVSMSTDFLPKKTPKAM